MYEPKSLLSKNKLGFLLHHLVQSAQLPGAVIEVGIFQGGTLLEMAKLIGGRKQVFGFDTFCGLPPPSEKDKGPHSHKIGEFSEDQYNEMTLFFLEHNVGLIKGVFPENATDREICFAHLDVDLYHSTFQSLEYLSRNLVKFGRVVVDDYGWIQTPGVKSAVADACEDFGLRIFDMSTEYQAVLVKL